MAAEKHDKYEYKPLQKGEIRLLELLPDKTHLSGRLRHWQTDGDPDSPNYEPCPPYTALSHHWDPKPADESTLPILILLDPEDPRKKNLYELRLRPGLFDGLQAISERMTQDADFKKRGPHIWVDAICINQKSPEDKDQQLGIMGDIYNDAQAVVVWLGKMSSEIEGAMEFVKELQKLSLLKQFITDEQYADKWKSLVMLVRRPWFRRLWIVQEIAAAKEATLFSRNQSVSWDDFASAWSIFVSQFEQIRTMLAKSGFFAKVRDPFGDVKLSCAEILVNNSKSLLRKRQDGEIAEHVRPLEYLLTSMSMFEVTEPHDIVYAILWLSSDASQGKKRGYAMSHRWNVSTPLSPETRPEKRTRQEQGGTVSDFLSPTQTHQKNRPRRKGSISEQLVEVPDKFSETPATYLEQKQADERTTVGTGIVIDYKQSVFELCCQVLTYIIKTTQRLDIICFHWAPPPGGGKDSADKAELEEEEDHPSWLLYVQRNAYSISSNGPDSTGGTQDHPVHLEPVNHRVNGDPLIGTPGSNRRPYLACGRTRATDVRINGRVLQVCGFILAKINIDAGAALNGVIPWKWRSELRWTSNAQVPPDRFWRTLVADKGLDDQPPPPRFRTACKWAFELAPSPPAVRYRSTGPNVNLEAIRNMGDGEAPLKEFLDRAIATTWNRKLFKTEGCSDLTPTSEDATFVGLGPQELEKGDVVCVLLGCAVPVILRPSSRRHDAHGMPIPPRSDLNGISGSVVSPPVCPKTQSAAGTDLTIIVTDEPSDDERAVFPPLSGPEVKKRPRNLSVRVNEPLVEHFTFVGECYVHGMMNGEIFHWADRHGRRLQDFFLH